MAGRKKRLVTFARPAVSWCKTTRGVRPPPGFPLHQKTVFAHAKTTILTSGLTGG